MRTTRDRIRHAGLFELSALALVTPLGSAVFRVEAARFGAIALVSTAIAMIWTYGYNLAFDHALLRISGTVRKTLRVRVVHAVLFEAGLTAVLVPIIAIGLGTGLWRALAVDVTVTALYLVYAFAFNWAYDVVFPVD